ncbi:MAG: sensor domain-containing diguanylate cyclase [Immundisolibacteraceae bacterium]|nr:sensor domain-containing diguanylate cyclase [Immundisolibacteraceae bacterium]
MPGVNDQKFAAQQELSQQLVDLQGENLALRHELNDLIARARENEQISKRLQESELKALAAQNLAELAEVLVNELATGPDQVITVMLHDPEFELRRIIDAEPDNEFASFILPVASLDRLKGLLPEPLQPRLAVIPQYHREFFFPGSCIDIKSTLVMPLLRRGELIGSLNFAYVGSQIYHAELATDILARTAAIVAVALENTLNQYRLRRAGLTDLLTALNNRRFFEQRLAEEFERAQRSQRPLCCLMIDVDHFKQVNDIHGHQAGDLVLQRVSAVMARQMRNTDVLARYGGEEFVVLLPETAAATAKDVAQRLRIGVSDQVIGLENGDEVSVTISIGLSLYDPARQQQDTPKVLLAYADQALYRAKDSGRNRVERAS